MRINIIRKYIIGYNYTKVRYTAQGKEIDKESLTKQLYR